MTDLLQTALADAARLVSEGCTTEAERAYETILEQAPGTPAAQAQLGVLALRRGDAARAEPLLAAAARSLPRVAALHLNLGTARRRLERHAEALAPLLRAALLAPGNGPYAALGLSASQAGRPALAASALRAAAALSPRDPDLWYNLGVALVEADRLAEAAAAYRRNGRLLRGRPANHATTDPLPGFPAEPVRPVSGLTCRHRLEHDRDQLRWLRAHGLLPAELADEPEAYQAVLDGLGDDERSAISFTLPDDRLAPIARSYNRFVRLEPSGWGDRPALSDTVDWSAMEAAFLAGDPRAVTIDGVLNAEALAALRRVCRASTFWHQIKGAGYLGAYFREGFNDPLVVRIAEELRAAMPRVLGGLPVRVIWAYSYDQGMVGINPHADFAAVNMNFWITEDDANLDPETGGLLVYRKAAPAEWDFRTYNTTSAEFIYDYLGDRRNDVIRVPHRANRALLFDSRLFHETDVFRFRPGFENRRINITMLFGDGGG
ncbi:tetratricopeptide repeat protein [Thalassobaculum sp.]|uniref:tetratricopeptide repeat protein n=1 Tax=Thalassobaculum sp. TaxID=2022740 RepID=UPI0032EB9E66